MSLSTTGQNLAGATYVWSGPNGFTSTAANPTIVASTTVSNGIYTIVATTPGGWTATAQTSVYILGAASSATISGNLTICAGQSTTLTATGGASYLWATGEQSASVVVTPTTSRIYSVMLLP